MERKTLALKPGIEAREREHEESDTEVADVRLFFAFGGQEPGCAAEEGDDDEADEGGPSARFSWGVGAREEGRGTRLP